jgi:hypothetical protein
MGGNRWVILDHTGFPEGDFANPNFGCTSPAALGAEPKDSVSCWVRGLSEAAVSCPAFSRRRSFVR